MSPTKFSELAIGQSFDFVNDETRFNSFFDRCIKISNRKYRSITTGIEYGIGSVKCKVYHVGESEN